MGFSVYSLYGLIQPYFRGKRMQFFLDRFRPTASTRILDVGGYVFNWEGVVPIESPITILNVTAPPATKPIPPRFTCCVADGRELPFADQSFDLAYSNSVIEHVGSYEDQQRFAREVRRVGRQVYVQTPNRWFFMEPHFLTPFIHFLPRRLGQQILRVVSVRRLLRRGDDINLKELAAELRLLTYREMRELFPDCEIHRERWLGMTKSFMAVRRDPAPGEGSARGR